MFWLLLFLAILGLCISLYTYYLEQKIKQSPAFKPICDLSDRISCTKPMRSPYANIFYFSNAEIGIAFYALIGILVLLHEMKLLFIASIGGCLVSCVLAYLLYFKIKSLCLLCTSLYIINFLILGLSIWRLFF